MVLTPEGPRKWDWKWNKSNAMHHSPGYQIKDINHYLQNRFPKIVILSTGRGHGGMLDNPNSPGQIDVRKEVVDHLESKGTEVHVLKMAKAIELYRESSSISPYNMLKKG